MVSGGFSSVYDDARRAEACSQRLFPGPYWLAYRDLPVIFREHVRGTRALDFGCGTVRSTRFLRDLDFDVEGADVAAHEHERARALEPEWSYRIVLDGELGVLEAGAHELVLRSFPFDNVPTAIKTRPGCSGSFARTGDTVRIAMLDVEAARPVEGLVWSDVVYRVVCELSGLAVAVFHPPLGRATEPFEWISGTNLAPGAVHVLAPAAE